MSRLSEELGELIRDMTYGSDKSLSQRIDEALPLLFNFNYPCWSEDYKKVLERKIVMHYFNYEIGCETPQLFQLRLEEKLNLIMPLYTQMYKSVIVDYDITKNINVVSSDTGSETLNINDTSTDTISDTENGTINKTNTGTTTNEVTSENVEFDVPQVKASGKDYASNLVDVTQNDTTTNNLTENNVSTNTRTSTNTKTDVSEHTNTINKSNTQIGNNIPIADLIIKYRESLVNIDSMIIEELHDLFMLVF